MSAYRSERVESIRNVILLAALRSASPSISSCILYLCTTTRRSKSLGHNVTTEAPRHVALGYRHSTVLLGLLAAGHIVRL